MFSPLQLGRYVRPHWRGLTVVLLTMLVRVGIDLLRPWPMKLVVDHVMEQRPVPAGLQRVLETLPGPGGPLTLLLWAALATVVIFVTGTLVSMTNTMASLGLGQRMTYDLGADLFLHLQRLSLIFHSRRSVGDSISRVTDDAYCIRILVNDTLIPLLQSLVMLVAMFLIMWRLSPSMTLLSLAVIPFLAVSMRVYRTPLNRWLRARWDLEARMMGVVQETLSAMPAVQAYGREEQEYRRFRGVADDTVTAYQQGTLAGIWFNFWVGLVTAIGTAAIMYLGARQVLNGTMTVGTILVFLAYLAALYAPLNAITTTATTWHTGLTKADRVAEIFRTLPEVTDRPGARDVTLRGKVEYEEVTFGYELNRPAVKAISFTARPGQLIAIVGPTGAGKTTLVNLLVRFFDPWSGKVLIDDIDVRDLQVSSLRRQVGMVLQDPFLFPLTVAQNVAYGRPDATREEIEAAAKAANADEFVRRLPDGYDTVIGEQGATLSGGEKQRLSIARAFLKNAPLLVLDEPTSALDARTEAQLLEALKRLMAGRTTFVIAHRLSTIRGADVILVVDQGQMVEKGHHEDLMSAGGLYASLYRQQMELAKHETASVPDPSA